MNYRSITIPFTNATPSLYPIYAVTADRSCGEWIGKPTATGEFAGRTEWLALDDGDDTHRDTYEAHPSETRLLLITWVD